MAATDWGKSRKFFDEFTQNVVDPKVRNREIIFDCVTIFIDHSHFTDLALIEVKKHRSARVLAILESRLRGIQAHAKYIRKPGGT